MVWRSASARRGRLTLGLLAVTLGVAVSTALATLALQVGDDLARTLRAAGPNFVVLPAGARLPLDLGGAEFEPARAGLALSESTVAAVKRSFWKNNVLEAAPELWVEAVVDHAPVLLIGTWFAHDVRAADGVWRTGLKTLHPQWHVDGRWPKEDRVEIVLGRAMAEALGVSIGQTVKVSAGGREENWLVTGVVTAGPREDGWAWAPLAAVQRLASRPHALDRVWLSTLVKPPPRRTAPDPRRDPKGYERYMCTAYPANLARDLGNNVPGAEVVPMTEVLAGEAMVVQRLDLHPSVVLPLSFGGWNVTATAGARATYYSNSIDPTTQLVSPRDVIRGYGEFEFDVRPPALARKFRRSDGSVMFEHVIEPYVTYRRVAGIDNFNQIIRFDYLDAIADTNEIEYGIANRFFTRRSTESVGKKAAREAREKKSLATQPYEALSITIRGKYFFDPYFGGALTPGRRNQFDPIDTLSAFTYGAVPRKFSPVNIDVRYRPSQELFADFRSDIDTKGGGLRAMSATFGISRSLVEAFSTFYYTRAVELVPSLQQYANAAGREPGTLRGSQWSPSVFLGNRERGLFGGVSLFFDFQKHPFAGSNRALISSTATIGYTWKCCMITAQDFTFNVGLRNENRIVFAFRLNGIGTFGTEKIGQWVK